MPASSKIKKVGTFNEIAKFPSFRVSVVILDYVYGLPFHAVMVFRTKIDFLFKSASTYCTAAHDNNANPAAASCKSTLRSMRLYI